MARDLNRPPRPEFEVQIADEGEAYVLAFLCRRTDRGWINVVKNLPLSLEPTHWRERRIDR